MMINACRFSLKVFYRHSRQITRYALAATLLAGLISGCGDRTAGSLVAEPVPVGGPPLLRRLTESQYRATIADIFGADLPVVARFERGVRSEGLIAIGTSEAGISPFSLEQYDTAAQGIADAVLNVERRADYVPCTPASTHTFDEACARAFIDQYGPPLFRRPLTAAQTERLLDAARQGSEQLEDFYAGLKYALVSMMTSPEFLLRVERTEPDPQRPQLHRLDGYSKATRLSYFLTNSTPDPELLRAVASGELDSHDGLARQVDRLIATPHFEQAVRAFFRDMLRFERFEELAKDSEIYPAFNSTVIADAQEQTLLDITHLLIDNKGDYRDLFTLRDTFLTRALGIVYRQPVATRNGWEKTAFPADSDRRGIQSHISFLALHSHPGRSSPTLRGEAIRNVFLCQEVPDPPADIDFSIVQNPSSTHVPTARDRLQAHNSEPACAGCHKVMDPIGLALENYDGAGTFRTHENSVLIDTSGFLDTATYEDSKGLAQALRDHSELPRCAVENIYRFAAGRDTMWEERDYMDYLIAAFAEHNYRLPALMRTIALSDNFYAISQPAENTGGYQQASTLTNQRDQS